MISYLDTSALMKLVLDEPGSDEAADLWRDAATRVSSLVTYVEMRAALAAAVRAGRLGTSEARRGRRTIETYWVETDHIEVDEATVAIAGDLAERHALRGYDAVQLATATQVAEGGQIVFVTWDRHLAEAALANGLSVAPGRL